MSADGLFIGLMSGTSMDGIDAVLTQIDSGRLRLLCTQSLPLASSLQARARSAARGDNDDLDAVAQLDRDFGHAFADATRDLLRRAGLAAGDIVAIGSPGQTLRHRVDDGEHGRFTVQVGDPSLIAEVTGITTVADFRRRDMAAGGEGAPLVPLFHAAQFGVAGERRAVVNIGGIANATLIDGTEVGAGFDCGPGNTLLDAWIRRHRGESYDAAGAWSAENAADEALLGRLLEAPYFSRRGPRSTGPELFNLGWLDRHLLGNETPGVVQATLAELTARAVVGSIETADFAPQAVYVCGGGARNIDLMRRLQRLVDPRGVRLATTDTLGIAAQWVEASAFAWLASRTLSGLAGNAPVVTGARGSRVLGGIYPAGEAPVAWGRHQ